jgi:tetratricopeptide (TPR) repeat protein
MDESTYAEKFAASEPLRMKSSAVANLALGRMYSDAERYPAALRHFQAAAQLDKESSEPHTRIAYVHRMQNRYNAALRAAQQAVALDENDGEAYYQLACALARLGRIKQAMTTLEKAVELDPDNVLWIADDPDLKPLTHLPAFKKLLQTDKN